MITFLQWKTLVEKPGFIYTVFYAEKDLEWKVDWFESEQSYYEFGCDGLPWKINDTYGRSIKTEYCYLTQEEAEEECRRRNVARLPKKEHKFDIGQKVFVRRVLPDDVEERIVIGIYLGEGNEALYKISGGTDKVPESKIFEKAEDFYRLKREYYDKKLGLQHIKHK